MSLKLLKLGETGDSGTGTTAPGSQAYGAGARLLPIVAQAQPGEAQPAFGLYGWWDTQLQIECEAGSWLDCEPLARHQVVYADAACLVPVLAPVYFGEGHVPAGEAVRHQQDMYGPAELLRVVDAPPSSAALFGMIDVGPNTQGCRQLADSAEQLALEAVDAQFVAGALEEFEVEFEVEGGVDPGMRVQRWVGEDGAWINKRFMTATGGLCWSNACVDEPCLWDGESAVDDGNACGELAAVPESDNGELCQALFDYDQLVGGVVEAFAPGEDLSGLELMDEACEPPTGFNHARGFGEPIEVPHYDIRVETGGSDLATNWFEDPDGQALIAEGRFTLTPDDLGCELHRVNGSVRCVPWDVARLARGLAPLFVDDQCTQAATFYNPELDSPPALELPGSELGTVRWYEAQTQSVDQTWRISITEQAPECVLNTVATDTVLVAGDALPDDLWPEVTLRVLEAG